MNRSIKRHQSSMVAAIATSMFVGLLCVLVLSTLGTYLIYTQVVPERSLGYLSGAIVFAATMLSSVVAAAKCGQKRLVGCICCGAAMIGLLVLGNILLNGGSFGGFFLQSFMILGTSTAIGLAGMGRKRTARFPGIRGN